MEFNRVFLGRQTQCSCSIRCYLATNIKQLVIVNRSLDPGMIIIQAIDSDSRTTCADIIVDASKAVEANKSELASSTSRNITYKTMQREEQTKTRTHVQFSTLDPSAAAITFDRNTSRRVNLYPGNGDGT